MDADEEAIGREFLAGYNWEKYMVILQSEPPKPSPDLVRT